MCPNVLPFPYWPFGLGCSSISRKTDHEMLNAGSFLPMRTHTMCLFKVRLGVWTHHGWQRVTLAAYSSSAVNTNWREGSTRRAHDVAIQFCLFVCLFVCLFAQVGWCSFELSKTVSFCYLIDLVRSPVYNCIIVVVCRLT